VCVCANATRNAHCHDQNKDVNPHTTNFESHRHTQHMSTHPEQKSHSNSRTKHFSATLITRQLAHNKSHKNKITFELPHKTFQCHTKHMSTRPQEKSQNISIPHSTHFNSPTRKITRLYQCHSQLISTYPQHKLHSNPHSKYIRCCV